MKILFVHQNFPGQFLHLAPELARLGHECLALTDLGNQRASATETLKYKHTAQPVDAAATRLGRNYTQMSDRAVSVARACLHLRQQRGYVPDVIFGHSGWGETLFLKEVWPEAKLLIYAEFYYRGRGADVGFDPEFNPPSFDQVMIAQGRAGHLGQAMLHADAGVAPTAWQASTFPPALRQMLDVIHDGVNTAVMAPNPKASFALPNGQSVKAGDEVLTFVNRNLEPYRGYHTFMRALPDVLKARPNAQAVIVGGDEVSYGSAPKGEKGWKDTILNEVRDRLDMSRVHFMGKIPYDKFIALMQVSRAHAYLTYPFVLSWSMIEAMSAGAHVIGSATAPVQEVIQDGVNGTLVDFFDIAAWSAALTKALAHPDQFQTLRQAARQTALDRYDQSLLLPQMVNFVERHGRKP
jgi:glycosyltransferase involved in cell wall biosynthesis